MKEIKEPICNECKYCRGMSRVGKVREVDCMKNPNLGAVTINYQKCCSFELP